MKIMKYIKLLPGVILAGISLVACESFLQADPPKTQIEAGTVFSNDATATSAIMGIYSEMISQNFASGALGSMTGVPGLSSDELVDFSNAANNIDFYTNSLQATNPRVNNAFWRALYLYINNVNTLIEGLETTKGVSLPVKYQITGEARFIRAFCYFYLVNLFGEVPLVLSADFQENRLLPRIPVAEVYNQIITDLEEAVELLPADYSLSGGERIRPTVWAAKALLARVYLYRKNYVEAEKHASEIIDNIENFTLVADVNDVFLANSRETIWQLQPVSVSRHTNEAATFIIQITPPALVALSDHLLNAFEAGDRRKEYWINSITDDEHTWFYPCKYKDLSNALTEYSMVLRLAEQYLIRAEARAESGDINGARQDLNTIRNRAGLENTTVTTRDGMLNAILHERQTEFFVEWGHRWLDLKRTGKANTVLKSIKTLNWQATDVLYPIPETELAANPNLTQNEGYD